ncbi:NAD(P)-dependent oxidoreductase [Nocardiopsis coralliicola]
MRITVLGANGGVGREIVAQALAGGHDVVALVRRPEAAEVLPDRAGLRVEVTDQTDAAALAGGIAGADGVINAISTSGSASTPTRVCEESTRAAAAAMRRAGVRRIVAISAATVTDKGDGPFTRMLVKPLLVRMLRHPRADSLRMEAVLDGSGLDWTVLRPPKLTDKPATGRYRTADGANVRGGITIPRADVAHAALAALTDPARIRTAVGVAS